jgi:hypothetical protein
VSTVHCAVGYPIEKNQQLQGEKQELVGEVAAVLNKRVGHGEVRTKVKAEKTTVKIAAGLSAFVRKGLR